jgi:O-antigen/teichoic acid export membrane protein
VNFLTPEEFTSMIRLRTRLQTLTHAPSAIQSSFLAIALIVAGGFDYIVNIVAGRRLDPTQFFIFVTVTALLQVMVQLTNVIRNVVAYYTAESTVHEDATKRVGMVLRSSWRWAWRWGLVALTIAFFIGPILSRFLLIDSPWPLWAAAFTVLLLFLRPVTDGTLQGIQNFFGLGSVLVLQSILRLVFVLLLLSVGLQATGAIVALPLASTIALVVAIFLLRSYFRSPDPISPPRPISWRYSTLTLIGLLAFGIMINIDPIVVRRFFGDAAAAAYAPVVTLGKMNLFIPLGIGLVLFPKATQRHAAGRDSRPVLLLALAATLIPGLLLTILFYLFPSQIVQRVFGDAYADPGVLLALVGLATTLYAGVSIWLNYALSLERKSFVIALACIVVLQILAMIMFHQQLTSIAWVMIIAGTAGNFTGAISTLPRHGSRN